MATTLAKTPQNATAARDTQSNCVSDASADHQRR